MVANKSTESADYFIINPLHVIFQYLRLFMNTKETTSADHIFKFEGLIKKPLDRLLHLFPILILLYIIYYYIIILFYTLLQTDTGRGGSVQQTDGKT